MITYSYWVLKRRLPNPENENMINLFLLALKDKQKAKDTIIRYRDQLQFFFKDKVESYSSISEIVFNDWVTKQSEVWKERTLQGYIKALRAFYQYCILEGFINHSPFNGEGKIKKPEIYWELFQPILNNENANVLQAYLLDMRNEGKSKEMIRHFRNGLQDFFKDIKKPFSSITSDDIQRWFIQKHKDWKLETKRDQMWILRSFYSYCEKEGYMDKLPLKRSRWVKAAEKYWEVQQPFRNQDNQRVVNDFLLHLKNINRTKKTIEEVRLTLQSFFRERNESFSSVTHKHINEWLAVNKNRKKQRTVISQLSFLRTFYRFCVKQGHVGSSPVLYKAEREGPKEKYWVLRKRLPNSENENVINEFLGSMKVSNLSEGYIIRCRSYLYRFFRDSEEAFHQLTSDTIIKKFIEQNKGLKESTISGYLSILSSFYTFCVEEEYMRKSPIKSRWFPRLPKPVPKYLEKEEISKVRLQCEKEAFRNRVIVEFFLATGSRIGEVHRLNKTDVDLENRMARVLGKGRKIRTVHFTEKCKLLLERYLESRTDDYDALFISNWETRLGISQLRNIVREIGVRARLSSPLHAHRFRHTFATELLAKGADLSFIAGELGHSDLHTTQIYAQIPNRELISMYRKYMG